MGGEIATTMTATVGDVSCLCLREFGLAIAIILAVSVMVVTLVYAAVNRQHSAAPTAPIHEMR